MIEQVQAGGKLLATILREGFDNPGIHEGDRNCLASRVLSAGDTI